jgi:hypothetical protein
MSTIGGPNLIDSGLILQLDAGNIKSYQSGSTTWFDKSGYANNGTLINGPTFSPANGGSIDLDGTNDQVNISAISQSVFSLISSSFTVSMWVKINNQTAGFISSNQSPSAGGQYHLIRRNGVLVINYYSAAEVAGTVPLPTGSWINIVHTYDFNTQTSSLYQQGSRVGIGGMDVPLITSASLILGWFGYGGSYLSGSIATTQIYNKILSANEVLQNYNATRTRFGL